MLNNYLKQLEKNGEVYLRVKARPNSAVTKIVSVMEDDTIKVDVAALPEKGKANVALLKFLVKEFGVSKDNIQILGGNSDKLKLIKINK